MLIRLENVVDAENKLFPLNVLLFARSVELAAVIVIEPPALRFVPLIEPSVPVNRLVPMVDDEITCLLLSRARSVDAVSAVRNVEPELEKFVVEAAPSVLFPVTLSVPATATLPALSMVVVALPPKYAVAKLEKLVEEALPEKSWRLVQVLRSPSRVEDAAVMVIEEPLLKVVPLMVPRVPVSKLVPIEEVAITFPFWSTARTELEMPVNQVVPSVASVVDDLLMLMRLENVVEAENKLFPLNVLLSVRSVEEADEPLLEMQVPPIEKQPLVRLIPLAKVDEAVDEVTLSAVV